MLRNLATKVAWIGKVAVFLAGLAMIADVTAVALAGTGIGDVFNLGRNNRVNAPSKLTGETRGSSLVIDNNGPGKALELRVGEGTAATNTTPPLKVNSRAKVRNLNADQVDGRGAGPRAYGLIEAASGGTEVVTGRGINGVVYHDPTFGEAHYCFDLAFDPDVGVGSPHENNNAAVGVSTNDVAGCPESHSEAAARTYAADTSTVTNDVNFNIMFE